MNKKILITNTGNRNIMYQGEFFNELAQQGDIEQTFREWSENLLRRFDDEKENLQYPIIRQYFDEVQYKPDIVYLFASDTPEGQRNDQDTLFAANIVKNMIINEFPETTVTVVRIKECVVDENAVIGAYASLLKRIYKKHPTAEFLINESGGTPQQIFALKVCSYFSIPLFMVKNLIVRQDYGRSRIVDNPPNAFFELLKTDNI